MNNEEKQLLLVDLCGRLPYGVKARIVKRIQDDSTIKDCTILSMMWMVSLEKRLEDVKPYLRPLSSMTEEEKEHLQSLHNIITDENYGDGYSPAAWDAISEFNDYCHAHHLDNRGLIEKGLALEAPEHTYD